jgi:YbbR domain-containing protein
VGGWQPPDWLTRNLRVKALATLLALASWVVVVYAGNPPDSRQILVHVQQDAQQLPGRYVLAHPIADVAVRISGTREHVDAFQTSSIRATPNFDAIRGTGLQQLPLSVVNTDPDVEIQDAPSSVTADVDLLGATSVPVVVHTSRTEVGFQIVSATADPPRVELIGPQRELGIAQAVVDVNFGNRTNTLVQDGVPIVVVDPRANDRPLGDVTANPATVRVTVVIQAVDGSAVSTVVPQLTGAVAAGHMLSQVLVQPSTVVLTGAENLLNGAQQTLTAPISLAGLTADRTVTVALQVPEGLKASVTMVTVHLVVVTLPEAVVTPTAPSPTPSPSNGTRTTQSATTSCTTTRSPIVGGQPTPCPP